MTGKCVETLTKSRHMTGMASGLHLAARQKPLVSSTGKCFQLRVCNRSPQTVAGSQQCRCFLAVQGTDTESVNLSGDGQGSLSRPGDSKDGRQQPGAGGTGHPHPSWPAPMACRTETQHHSCCFSIFQANANARGRGPRAGLRTAVLQPEPSPEQAQSPA